MRLPAVYLLLAVMALVGSVPAARAEITAQQVNEAIDKGVAYLKRQQRTDGSWTDSSIYPGGITALCTLALLNSGEPPEDKHVDLALKFLRKLRSDKTYVVSLQTMVFAKATPKRDRALIGRNVRWLEQQQVMSGDTRGSWSYPGPAGDNSNTQFALLALHDAERAGEEVNGRTWRLAYDYWLRVQNPDGSWGYGKGAAGSGSMTCAGITSLVITSDKVRQNNAQAEGDRIRCCVESESKDDPVGRALAWLGRRQVFSVKTNPGEPRAWLLYYLYGLERVGRFTAQRFIGEHDWYREGADHLLKIQAPFWDHWRGIGHYETDERIATSFSLLFLSKGRWPVLLAKLKHGIGDDWKRHQSDVANLTRYVESRWERDLIWQVADVRVASADDLLESPVLFYCGRDAPIPKSDEERDELAKKLRSYLDRSGFLFAEALSGGTEFDSGFRDLMKRVFPEPEYRLMPLPPEHPIWRTEEAVDAKYVRPLWGIEFGCRTSVVYSPPDSSGKARPSLSCLWELSRAGRDQQFSPEVQARVDAGLSIGINVLAYATNRELKFKDPAKPKTASISQDPFSRGKLYIANLRHPGGCTAAPRALITLLETMQNELKIRVGIEQRELYATDDSLFDYHIVFMHGRNAFHLTEDERQQLKIYVERGGMILANAICASRSFAESFRREMKTIFPERPLEPIAPDDPLLTGDYGGFDLSVVTRRDPQGGGPDEPLTDAKRQVAPELEGISFDGRYGVVFSRYDLSCALEKHNSLECQGYIREDAARIGMNVVLYSLYQ